ncbi:MAG: hypothetical protein GWM89_07160 [Candidatus Dadabacteria bacterium]|nr:hypothetical protein [Candidatus Dadabacteria bacterium]NIV42791.1 hypothetical protein [Candidatus Dadabacteria bacterium]NIY22191.1 hypothetical protein [Candidatus Dadabacteria bacterium]
MSSKILLKFLGGCLALFIVMGIAVNKAEAGAVVASGSTETPASQIIVPVIQEGFSCKTEGSVSRNTLVQLTNTSESEVTVHIQFLDEAGCTEVNFFDTFTGEDTHVYDLGNCAVNGGAPGSCPIDTDRNGVMVFTPVVSGQDNADAKAFNHLHAVVDITTEGPADCWDGDDDPIDYTFRFNAAGRLAVDLTTGNLLEDDTVLDGAATGLQTILPSELMYHYNSNFADANDGAVYADLIVVAISDDYTIPNEYKAVNGITANFSINNIVDDFENSISCGDRQFECLEVVGINTAITRIDDAHDTPDIICDETDHPTGYDRLVARPDATAAATVAVLGVYTSDFGGAAHVFAE